MSLFERSGGLMIISDDPENVVVLTSLLEPLYAVSTLTSVEQALRAALAQVPQLVLLDVRMPDPDGFRFLERLRAQPEMVDVPVIFLAAAADETDEQKGFDRGASDYIHKPIVPSVVLARVKAHLEAKAARELLKKTNEKLSTRVAEGAHALEQAQRLLLQSEKLAAMGMLAAGVAHEINNPITYVDSNLTTLTEYVLQLQRVVNAYAAAEALLPEDARASLAGVKEEADFEHTWADLPQLVDQTREGVARVRTIVRDLKDFSRADDNDWRWANLGGVLDSTLNIAKNEFKYHCTVHKQYADLPDVWCLPPRLGQVFMNLVVNAAHAIEGRGDITLTTEQVDDQWVKVSVADTGKGIPPEVLGRIFEPFFTTKPAGKGTGLGLPTVQQIVERHGGRIDVASEVGTGTTFTVTLPIGPRP